MSAIHSLAAQAVAAAPPTLAPPSFEGHDWLYILNLFIFLAGTELLTALMVKLLIDHLLCAIAPYEVPAGEMWWSRDLLATRVHLPRSRRRWLAWMLQQLETGLVALISILMRFFGPAAKPGSDDWRSPIMLHRRIGILWSGAFALRCFSEMQSLWRWYPLDPVGTGRGLALKRMLDPVAADIGYLAIAIYFLSLPGITEQLRKEPFPVDMWTSLPLLKRPAGVVLCCLGAAIAVVAFR